MPTGRYAFGLSELAAERSTQPKAFLPAHFDAVVGAEQTPIGAAKFEAVFAAVQLSNDTPIRSAIVAAFRTSKLQPFERAEHDANRAACQLSVRAAFCAAIEQAVDAAD